MEGAVAFADLRDGKLQGTDTGLKRAGLEAVGVAIALGSALIGGGSDVRSRSSNMAAFMRIPAILGRAF